MILGARAAIFAVVTLLETPIADARAKAGNVGRAGWYRAEYCATAHDLALLGQTDVEMAETFGIDVTTFCRWLQKPAFRAAVLSGRGVADGKVARSLYERARGYSHDAVKIFLPPGASEPVYAPYTEHYPPDTAAASLWLRNRQGAKWKDKTETAVSGTLTLEHLVLQAVTAREAPGELIEQADSPVSEAE